jgi:hypothetical protein
VRKPLKSNVKVKLDSKLVNKTPQQIAKAFSRKPTDNEIDCYNRYFALRKKGVSGEEARKQLAKRFGVKPSRIGFMYWQVQRFKNSGKSLVKSASRIAARERLLHSLPKMNE